MRTQRREETNFEVGRIEEGVNEKLKEWESEVKRKLERGGMGKGGRLGEAS